MDFLSKITAISPTGSMYVCMYISTYMNLVDYFLGVKQITKCKYSIYQILWALLNPTISYISLNPTITQINMYIYTFSLSLYIYIYQSLYIYKYIYIYIIIYLRSFSWPPVFFGVFEKAELSRASLLCAGW